MQDMFERELLVVTGKGGVGKTTIAAALGVLASERGLRTIVVEVGDQTRLPDLFGRRVAGVGLETSLRADLASISIDPDRALLEWLQRLGGRISGRLLASSGTFQYFAAAAPGAKELVSMVKISELARGGGSRGGRSSGYDLVVLDAPATGHALGMLASPQTFGAIARVGPIAGQARRMQELLEDSARTAYVAVAHASEMAVTEALELQDGLRRQLGRDLTAVVVNGLMPKRFTATELQRIEEMADRAPRLATVGARDDAESVVMRAAADAARSVHDRARFQHNQLARLRRRSFEVIGLPFLWGASVDVAGVERLAAQLARRL